MNVFRNDFFPPKENFNIQGGCEEMISIHVDNDYSNEFLHA